MTSGTEINYAVSRKSRRGGGVICSLPMSVYPQDNSISSTWRYGHHNLAQRTGWLQNANLSIALQRL